MSVERNQDQGGVGPMIGSVIIVLLLVVGGYYSLRTGTSLLPINQMTETTSQPVPIISTPTTPPQESTEIGDIEADAEAVDVTAVDSGLDNLDLLVRQ